MCEFKIINRKDGSLIGEEISYKAKEIGTIPYEVMTGIGKRVSRVYIKNGKVVKIKSLE